MRCAICKKKPATVHLTQIVGDKMRKLDLCKGCAEAEGANDPMFAPADLIPGEPRAVMLMPSDTELKSMTVLSAAVKRQLIANSWKLITP
jgi:hypothetical protein